MAAPNTENSGRLHERAEAADDGRCKRRLQPALELAALQMCSSAHKSTDGMKGLNGWWPFRLFRMVARMVAGVVIRRACTEQ